MAFTRHLDVRSLVLVSIAGIYAVWGLGPSRGSPKLSIPHSSPSPSMAFF